MIKRCCGTCKYRTPINATIPCQCIGCLINGECTKWEERMDGEAE